jgi:UDP-GlcNAc3NAcA epimerase
VRLLHVVGARPQFVKLAPVVRAIDRHNAAGLPQIESIIVHTGQHYDVQMSEVFFAELEIPLPSVNLEVGSGSHAYQTAAMLERFEPVLAARRPDVVLVYGDTNSTLAGTLAASKELYRVAHVEAGLRSFNRAMPEEQNRIVADHLADLLLAPTATAVTNLEREGLGARTRLTGDVMRDALEFHRRLAVARSTVIARLGLAGRRFAIATVHRAENTAPPNLSRVLDALAGVATHQLPVVLALHPRTAARIRDELSGWRPPAALQLIEPLAYLDMLALLEAAALVLTDSGGLQKEALFVGRPCVTLREETEWTETLELGGNLLAGIDPARVAAAAAAQLSRAAANTAEFRAALDRAFGAGDAAARIVTAIAELGDNPRPPGRSGDVGRAASVRYRP